VFVVVLVCPHWWFGEGFFMLIIVTFLFKIRIIIITNKHKVMTKTKVLYFPSNSQVNYYDIYLKLKSMFNGRSKITVDEVQGFLDGIDEKFYIKENFYQLELYNPENEYVFCINKPTP
jgi:hypothetical protein